MIIIMLDNAITVTKILSVVFVESKYTSKLYDYSGKLSRNELIFKIDGETIINFDKHVFREIKGCVRFLPKTENEVKYTSKRICSGSCIDIFFDTLEPIESEAFSFSCKNYGSFLNLFKNAEKIWKQKKPGYEYAAMSCLYKILELLCAEAAYVPSSKAEIVRPGYEYITEHYTEKIFVEQLAKMCGISHTYFKEVFASVYKMTPKEYIIHLRIQYACELLKSGIHTISEIAEITGYQNVYYFSRSFKKIIGVPPSKYA